MPLSTFLRGGHPSTPPHSDNLEHSTSSKLSPIGIPDEHLEAFNSFKENLTKAGLYSPATTSSAASADDATLARFFRARRYDPRQAQAQWANHLSWRKSMDVDRLYATFDHQTFIAAQHYYPRWTGRRDKHGVPVYVYKLSALGDRVKEINSVPVESRYERIVVLWQLMTQFITPLCTALPHPGNTAIYSINSIIDLSGVSLSTMWSLRHHLQQASELATHQYPESMNITAVVNAPAYFATVWSWISAWFDEGTRNKIHVLGKDPGPVLRTLIDTENLPKAYGGTLDFEFDDDPNLDDDAKNLLGEYPQGPIIFVNGKAVRPTVPSDTTPARTSATTNGSAKN
ncbi:CRAL/TRIO domain-containing protein [Stereum hirsutum FP-91666 SS1]|uniref:CRAL/TRIO domain-containing protein n=1 Tax=Stereum hirsutum (strain FP-91666) TaxID=721885 RepID=UPI0004449DC0|nr:CRAL/TRIO domain-containing protein [Stereum hirsutum FP-91666 SS1]EIM85828.1 CRAL/TRIO domain-containing protein [Stereum hirsutum FP-91666 SS1]